MSLVYLGIGNSKLKTMPSTLSRAKEKGKNSKLFSMVVLAAFATVMLATWRSAGAWVKPADRIEPLPPGASVETVLNNMNMPVAMAFDPQGRLFYTERSGAVRLFENGALRPEPVITFDVDTCGERGLIGIALDPNFGSNHYIYVYYSAAVPSSCSETENRVARFVENNGVGSEPQVIFTSPQITHSHNGGNIHFGPDGKLYVTVGDNGLFTTAQDVTRKNGKIHRINPDGTIPDDNPVFTQTGALPSLYARGLRNSFDFVFDPLTPGRIFASENGPSCDDELNRIEAGYNYGWRDLICEDDNPDPTYNTIPPMWYLGEGQCCDAPTGITVYSGYRIPQWRDDLFMVSYNFPGKLRHFYLNEDRTAVLDVRVVEDVQANMDIETGPDGALWYIKGGGWGVGQLKRIVGPGVLLPTPTPTPLGTPTETPTPIPTVPATGCAFSDMPEFNPFYEYVQCLACGGIIGGYPCGGPGEPCDPQLNPYFRPNNAITRAQLAKIISVSWGYDDPPGEQMFQDVPPDSLFALWVQRLATRNIMSGYPCGGPEEPCVEPANLPYFRPGSNATRGQIAKIVALALGFASNEYGDREPPAGVGTRSTEWPIQSFEDVPPGSTFHEWVEGLAGLGVMSGYPCGQVAGEPCGPGNLPYFRPGNNATRGQVSKIVVNAFFPLCGEDRVVGSRSR